MMKNYFKVSFNSDKYDTTTKFYVNEKKRTVVCVLEGFLNVPEYRNGVWVDNKYFKAYGVAKCSPEDTFDAERGKRIAMAKAENQIYLDALRHIEPYVNNMNDVISAFVKFNEKVYRTCAHNEDYIDRLSCPSHPDYVTDLADLKKRK